MCHTGTCNIQACSMCKLQLCALQVLTIAGAGALIASHAPWTQRLWLYPLLAFSIAFIDSANQGLCTESMVRVPVWLCTMQQQTVIALINGDSFCLAAHAATLILTSMTNQVWHPACS